jgi:hypothetical protein
MAAWASCSVGLLLLVPLPQTHCPWRFLGACHRPVSFRVKGISTDSTRPVQHLSLSTFCTPLFDEMEQLAHCFRCGQRCWLADLWKVIQRKAWWTQQRQQNQAVEGGTRMSLQQHLVDGGFMPVRVVTMVFRRLYHEIRLHSTSKG